ncbi:MAG: right-handed parallel beta-helix repeat-containing protein, partial [Actinomycetota bacterium]|nr:right-handed parallel beta-helix repeat-containing protein [Actinomycetota bacterium]
MSNNGKTCATWSYAHTDKCALDAAWVANRWCARSCFENGNGYDAGGCCPHPSPPPLPPTPPAPPATPPSPPALPPLGVGYATVLFVDASGGSDSNDGLSLPSAFASISHAVSVATSSTAIFVASGVYRNNNYGLGRLNNGPYVNIKELSDILLTNLPGHSPKIEFDGSGAIRGQDVVGLEISGFEISGPNQEITYDEAMADRLLHSNRFSGRGIAIWGGSHIHIHHNVVHDAPNSGIRVNRGDYCVIEHNVVSNCTWWSSNAESGIVLAESVAVDQNDTIKMIMRRNLVFDNMNKIPYYNANYDDPEYLAANQMH